MDLIPILFDYTATSVTGARPVTAADMIAWLKLDSSLTTDSSFVAEMEPLIDSAIAIAEGFTKRTFRTTTFKAYLSPYSASSYAHEIRRSPLQSLTSISYYTGGVLTVLDSSTYEVAISDDFSLVKPVSGYSWPSHDDMMRPYEFVFVAGYADGELPDALATALKMHVAYLWAHRGDCDPAGSGTCSESSIPASSRLVYSRYRIFDMLVGR